MLNQEDLSTLRENLAFWEQLSPAQRELLHRKHKARPFLKRAGIALR